MSRLESAFWSFVTTFSIEEAIERAMALGNQNHMDTTGRPRRSCAKPDTEPPASAIDGEGADACGPPGEGRGRPRHVEKPSLCKCSPPSQRLI